ncbi:MAG TPA: helix-turn-helix transcriptional regulator [Candidatus Scatomorpha stercoravium]|nr:helix-turn-helix transcriptional regulator [Candidatus Scatomorpha stercoravium]
MYKNRAPEGGNNICGRRVRELRLAMPGRVSHRMLSERLQIEGLDLDKNAVQRIESGERFVTDIELKVLSRVLGVSADELLGE